MSQLPIIREENSADVSRTDAVREVPFLKVVTTPSMRRNPNGRSAPKTPRRQEILTTKQSHIDILKAEARSTVQSIFSLKTSKQSTMEKKQENIVQNETEKLNQILQQLSNQQRLDKAVRHFYDGHLLRTPINDIDGNGKGFLRVLWMIVNDIWWNNFCWLLTLVYQLIVFFEPQYAGDQINNPYVVMMTELSILAVLSFDQILNLVTSIKTSNSNRDILRNKKLIFKSIFLFFLYSDFIRMFLTYPQFPWRFGRPIRGLIMFCYSKDLRRNIKGILDSISILIVLFIVYFIVIAVWAFVGINLIGDISDQVPLDTLTVDYSDFGKLSFMLYILSTLDFYPDIVQPTLSISPYYQIYFLVFLLLFLFVFIPIPQALVYEVFRKNRQTFQGRDHEKQVKALNFCFTGLLEDHETCIQESKARLFFSKIFGSRITPAHMNHLIKLLDVTETNQINQEEFNHIYAICHCFPEFDLDRPYSLKAWDWFTQILQQKFHLREIVEGVKFNTLTTFITLINCLLIIASFFITDAEAINIIQQLDSFFFACYATEALLKILGQGIYDYFCDTWNKFDFTLVVVQCFLDYILINTISSNISSGVKANRVLRLAKFQRVFRLLKAFRSLKILSIVFDSLNVFGTVTNIFTKILIVIPVVFHFSFIIWIITYMYAVLSVEFLNSTVTVKYSVNPYSGKNCDSQFLSQVKRPEAFIWTNCTYTDFDTITNALLSFVQIFIFNWSDLINLNAHRLKNYWIPASFFTSYALINTFLLALVSGLVWEIFNQLTNNEEEQEKQMILERNRKEVEALENFQRYYDQRDSPSKLINDVHSPDYKDSILGVYFTFDDDFLSLNIGHFSQRDEISLMTNTEETSLDEHKIKPTHFFNIQQKRNNPFFKGSTSRNLISKNRSPKGEIKLPKAYLEEYRNCFRPFSKKILREEYNQLNNKFESFQDNINLISESFFQTDSQGLSGEPFKRDQEILKIQTQLTINIRNILNNDQSCRQTVEGLMGLEQYITRKLLSDRGFTKFIYRDKHGQWFTTNQQNKKIIFKSVGDGPWCECSLFPYQSAKDPQIYYADVVIPFPTDAQFQLGRSLDQMRHEMMGQTQKSPTLRKLTLQLQQQKYFLFINVFTPLCLNENKVTQIYQLWYVKQASSYRASGITGLAASLKQRTSTKFTINNLVDLNSKGKDQKLAQQEAMVKHDAEHAIHLMNELWPIIHQNEQTIRNRIYELCTARYKIQNPQT